MPAHGPIVIGGAARNGKTMLAGMIGRASVSCWGSPFELLLNVQPGDAFAWSRTARLRVLRDYMTRQRATSPDRVQASGPGDFVAVDGRERVIADAAERGGILSGIASLLDRIAADQGARLWIGADYHAECDYEFLRRKIPELRLIVVIRDPVEAVAASLYWRTFPDRVAEARCEAEMRVALWKLSAAIAQRFASRYSREVLVLDSNALWSGRNQSISLLAEFIGCEPEAVRKSVLNEPWFVRNGANEFLCPDGTRRPLLSHDEIAVIERATSSLRSVACDGSASLPGSLRLATRFPRAARHLIALRYRPRQRLSRNLSVLRRAIRLAATI